MKIAILFATLLSLALFTAGFAQTLDEPKLAHFYRLPERNNGIGNLLIANDTNSLYTRA